MSEALGAAVLTVDVDDTRLQAAFQSIRSEADRTAAYVQQTFERAARQGQRGVGAGGGALGGAGSGRVPQPPQPPLPPQPPQPPQPPLQPPTPTRQLPQQSPVSPQALDTIAGMTARLRELQTELRGVSVGTTEFQRLQEQIRRVRQELSAAIKPPVPPAALDSIAGMTTRLRELQGQLERLPTGSYTFQRLQEQIRALRQELNQASKPPVPPDAADSVAGLTARLREMEAQLRRLPIGSEQFVRLREEIDRTRQSINEGLRPPVPPESAQSIAGMTARLRELQGQLQRLPVGSVEFRNLQTEITKTRQELDAATNSGRKFGDALGPIGGQLLGAFGFVGVGFTAVNFFKDSIKAAAELETTTRKLSNTLGPQGAGAALAFTRDLSDKLGLNFRQLANSYGSFTAAATAANVPMQVQKDLFASVARAGQVLGLSNYEIQGALLALQQVASKGVVSMEELRQQLGERLPIALSATAKGLGITQKQLFQLVESGKLTADKFFPALTKGLNDLTKSADGVPTAAQNFAKLGNAFDELQTSFGESLIPDIVAQVKNLTQALEGFKVTRDAVKTGLGGPLGGIGILPKDSAAAVGQLRAVQKQYNLTDKEIRALYTDAAKLEGRQVGGNRSRLLSGLFGTDIFVPDPTPLQGDALDRALGRVGGLAANFRQRNPDRRAQQLNQEALAKKETDRLETESQVRQKQLNNQLADALTDQQVLGIRRQIQLGGEKLKLDDRSYARLELQVGLEEKINAEKAAQLRLQRELAKPRGAGDGQKGTQNLATINDLENQARVAGEEVRLAYEQAGNRLVQLTREASAEARQILQISQQRDDSLLKSVRRVQDARSGIASPVPVVDLRSAEAEGKRQTALFLQGLQRGIEDATRDAERAAQALQEAQRRQASGEPVPRLEMAKLESAAQTAAGELTAAGAEAGRSLLDFATQARDRLRSAQNAFNDVIRSNPNVFSPQLVQEQLRLAREEFQPLVDRGDIRPGIPTQTPEQVFGLAGIARRFNEAEQQKVLARTIFENTRALETTGTAFGEHAKQLGTLAESTQALADKDWKVTVNVLPPAAQLN